MNSPLPSFQVLFEEGAIIQTCEGCLEQMRQTSQELNTLTGDDMSLVEAHKAYRARWDALRLKIDKMRMTLEEVPERWKDYNHK